MEGFSDGSSTLPASTKTKGHPKGCPFVLGSDRRRRSPPLGIEMLGIGKAAHLRAKCRRSAGRLHNNTDRNDPGSAHLPKDRFPIILLFRTVLPVLHSK